MIRDLHFCSLLAICAVLHAADANPVGNAPQVSAPTPPAPAQVAPSQPAAVASQAAPQTPPRFPQQPGSFRKQVIATHLLHTTSNGYSPDDLADLQVELLSGSIVVGVVQHSAGAVILLAKPAATLDEIAAISAPAGASEEAKKRLEAARDQTIAEERQRIESWSSAQQQRQPGAPIAPSAGTAPSTATWPRASLGPAPPPASLGPNPTADDIQKARAERAHQIQEAAKRENPQWQLKPTTDQPQTPSK